MEHYGLLARDHWRDYAPNQYQELVDAGEAEAFFTELGQTASDRISAIRQQLERELPKDLPYLEKVGQMNVIRKQAEEIVLGEMVYSVHEDSDDPVLRLEMMLNQLPSESMIQDLLNELYDQHEDLAESNGLGPDAPMIEEHQERETRLLAMRKAIDLGGREPEELTPEEAEERIPMVRPFLPAELQEEL